MLKAKEQEMLRKQKEKSMTRDQKENEEMPPEKDAELATTAKKRMPHSESRSTLKPIRLLKALKTKKT